MSQLKNQHVDKKDPGLRTSKDTETTPIPFTKFLKSLAVRIKSGRRNI
jgi:hypothetical protein